MLQDVLRDFILYNNADKMVGKIDNFKPPKLASIIEDFRGAGMDAAMPVDMGMEPLEASWQTSGIDRGTYAAFGLMNGLRTTTIVRAAVVDPITGLPKPVIHTMVGTLTVVEPSEYKPGERATLTTTIKVIHYKLSHTVPGVPLIEINIPLGIRIINGIDQLLAIRLITGH